MIQVPQVKLPRPVHAPEHCWMLRMPFDIKHIIIRLLKAVKRRGPPRPTPTSRTCTCTRTSTAARGSIPLLRPRLARTRRARTPTRTRFGRPSPPQLNRPIHRARQEKIAKIDVARTGVEVETRHRSRMAAIHLVGVQTGLGGRAIVSMRLVD
jgi:hypothetical protein